MTFVIQAENRADVLAQVVQFFQELNVEIEALYMVRRRSSETLRIHVTVETNEGGRRHIEANLQKVLNVRSVKAERGTEKVLLEAPDEKSGSRSRR